MIHRALFFVRNSRFSAQQCLVAALATLLFFLPALLPDPAGAHGGNPEYRSVINAIEPAGAGLEGAVIDYDADLRLTVPAGTEVEIPGYEGEPYARILADGRVQVNRHSPSAYLNTDRYGRAEPPASANPKATPDWETLREDGVFQWHDHRSHWMSPQPPEHLQGVAERTEVFDYEIPLQVDGKPGVIDGTLYWVGPGSASKLPFIFAGAALLVLGGAAAVIMRRRSRAAEDDSRPPADVWG